MTQFTPAERARGRAILIERAEQVIAECRASGERITQAEFAGRVIGWGGDYADLAGVFSDPGYQWAAILSDCGPVDEEGLKQKVRDRRAELAATQQASDAAWRETFPAEHPDSAPASDADSDLALIDAMMAREVGRRNAASEPAAEQDEPSPATAQGAHVPEPASRATPAPAPEQVVPASEPAANDKTEPKPVADGVKYFKLWRHIVQSPQFESLSFAARSLLIDLCLQFNGGNNGNISAPHSRMKGLGFRHHATLANALAELLATGFICETKRVRTRARGRTCQLYGITWLKIDACPALNIAGEDKPRNTWKTRDAGTGAKAKTTLKPQPRSMVKAA